MCLRAGGGWTLYRMNGGVSSIGLMGGRRRSPLFRLGCLGSRLRGGGLDLSGWCLGGGSLPQWVCGSEKAFVGEGTFEGRLLEIVGWRMRSVSGLWSQG